MEKENNFITRMIDERKELSDKLEKCTAFCNSDNFEDIVKDKYAQFLLKMQRELMDRYNQVLSQRIEIASNGSCNNTINLSFGMAIEALKMGLIVRRRGWNGKNIVVFKQVPASINDAIIPKMQSIPNEAKKLILNNKKVINYTSQCLIYNTETCRADSWVASISDIFAEDWEIVNLD